ncbi:SixA phosphatase family protein [Thioalkalivibrio paradoxus]|uniref:SixA phosphatase family protein n=1 Tax=Thioalkalivibrio paradoxus TaxID=108010 RepID=UPI00022C0FA6|nr:phosphoglycerate mutase family protein [Thioalkalivibrio paradoxus]
MKTRLEPGERLLILIRHAQAGDPERFLHDTGRPDRERPLTAVGVERNREAARGLGRLLKQVDHVWTSPYLRARQTAEGVAEVFGRPVEALEELGPPWRRDRLSAWVEPRLRVGESAVLVGHEPDLSGLIGHWLCATGAAPVPMEKGSACALRCRGAITPGSMELLWKLPQYALRKL